jgi:hypothetical protein
MSHSVDTPLARGANAEGDVELPLRNTGQSSSDPLIAESQMDDLEAGHRKTVTAATVDPSKLLDPIRTDPIKALELRKRRLDRQADSFMPEIHYVGQITSAKNVILDSTEGALCRFALLLITTCSRNNLLLSCIYKSDGKLNMGRLGSILAATFTAKLKLLIAIKIPQKVYHSHILLTRILRQLAYRYLRSALTVDL